MFTLKKTSCVVSFTEHLHHERDRLRPSLHWKAKDVCGKTLLVDNSLLLEEPGTCNDVLYASCSESLRFGDGPSSPPLFVAIQVPPFHRLKTVENLLVFPDFRIINYAVGLLDGKEDLRAMQLTSLLHPGLHNSSFSILGKSSA
jgi:hypothetical protein